MHPIAFNLGPITVHWFGICIALAFLAGLWTATRRAPRAGIPGELIADLVDVDSGAVLPLRAQSAGVLYARVSKRWAPPGERLAKIAGTTLERTGKLLGA